MPSFLYPADWSSFVCLSQEADESLNFDEMILEAAKCIITATSALVRAASAAQRELIDQVLPVFELGSGGETVAQSYRPEVQPYSLTHF